MMSLICELQLPFVCDGSHLQSNLFQHYSHMTKPHYHVLDVAIMPLSQSISNAIAVGDPPPP